ncbi:hypothetical protein F5Y07DRAFT_374658 [Xylaria sp. FL0933]|nr:hypothetical protein F5Y07DRAFT_374658 [Xylaria sp. FL0933]
MNKDMTDGTPAGIKRSIELEEQNHGHDSKKSRPEQFPTARFLEYPLFQPSDSVVTLEQQEAKVFTLANHGYPPSSILPPALGLDLSQHLGCYSEPWPDQGTCATQSWVDASNTTAEIVFQPDHTPEPHLKSSGVIGIHDIIKPTQAQRTRINETTSPTLSQNNYYSAFASEDSITHKYESEHLRDKNEISPCGSSISSCLQSIHLPAHSEGAPDFQSVKPTYDACFGVIVTKPVISQGDHDFDNPVPVNLNPFDTLFKLHYQDTGKYLGIVVIPPLHELLASYQLEVKASVSKVKSDQPLPTVKRGKSKPAARSDYSLRIVVFGSKEDKVSIGDLLSASDIYLQHPLRTECDPGIEYFNPHYLVRVGGEMPKIEELSQISDVEDSDSVRTMDEVSRSRILRIFDHAEG